MKISEVVRMMERTEFIHPDAEVHKDHEFGFNVLVHRNPTDNERKLMQDVGLKFNAALRCYFPVGLKK